MMFYASLLLASYYNGCAGLQQAVLTAGAFCRSCALLHIRQLPLLGNMDSIRYCGEF